MTLSTQYQVALDCELGCPSISPPDPDIYLPDAIDPATAAYGRLKAALILHMIEVKLQPTDLQDALGQMMLPIADHAVALGEDHSVRRVESGMRCYCLCFYHYYGYYVYSRYCF